MKINRIIQTAVIAIFAASIGCKEPQQKKANAKEVAADQKPVDIKSAAEAGNADAQYKLAIAYGEGDGVPKDILKQIEWLEKASTQNHPAAMLGLGNIYFLGSGVIQDKQHAFSLWKKAAELGDSNAQGIFGSFMALGQLGEENVTEGIRFLRLAAEAGNKETFSILGSVLNYSTKDYYNPVEAAKWLLISQLLGGDESESLSEIENKIGEDKFAEGRRLANEWYKMNILEKK